MEKKAGDLIRIAIVGPESTGKTTLARQLADHYHTAWVEEYARTYIGQLNREYTLTDIERIAEQQLLHETKKAAEAEKILFCDTNLLVTKIWAEFVFGSCPVSILNSYVPSQYAFHLLTAIDIEWEADPQREHPEKREELFGLYHAQLLESKVPFGIVTGRGAERLENALSLIEPLITKF